MVKKIVGTGLYIFFLGFLIFGGIIRTRAVSGAGVESGGKSTEISNQSFSGEVIVSSLETIQIMTDEGEVITIEGRAVRYLNDNHFPLLNGTVVEFTGFLDGDHFEAAGIHLPGTGETIFLRDQAGRPAWAGKNQGSKP